VEPHLKAGVAGSVAGMAVAAYRAGSVFSPSPSFPLSEFLMTSPRYDVVGIGNAIVDIIGRCDDAFLVQHGATKGHMRLVEPATIMELYNAMGPAVEASGGSAANTIAGIASLGGKTGFVGKVADDEFGRIFAHDIKAQGVAFSATPQPNSATSRSLILVTPDGERTMNTYLGVSTDFHESDLDAALIGQAGIVYLEGYLFDRPEAKAAFRAATTLARKANAKVAMTLSDGFCVDRHRDEFLAFIRSDVDILFANESEITALYQTTSFDEAVRKIKSDAKLVALTRGVKGSVILSDGADIAVPVEAVAHVVDTTGAGDLYAGGFLYGIAKGLPLDVAGRLGSMAAAEVISHVGARPAVDLSQLARQRGLLG
jgi:sugar/nucleoside kinase (ribokinase family)